MRASYRFDPVALPTLCSSDPFLKLMVLDSAQENLLSRFACIPFPYLNHPIFEVFKSNLREFVKNSYDAGATQMWCEVTVLQDGEDEKNSCIEVKIRDDGSKKAQPIPRFFYDPWDNLLKASDKENQKGFLGGNHYGLVFVAYELERYCCGSQLTLEVTPREGATVTLSGPLVKKGMAFTQDTANLVLLDGLVEMAEYLKKRKLRQVEAEEISKLHQLEDRIRESDSKSGKMRPANFTLRFLSETRREKNQEKVYEKAGELVTRLKDRPSMTGIPHMTEEGQLCSDLGEPVTLSFPPVRQPGQRLFRRVEETDSPDEQSLNSTCGLFLEM